MHNFTNLISACYGVILFRLNENNQNNECVLIRTPPKNGSNGTFGFPKGKAEKNKNTNVRENIYQCVIRELLEESNVSFEQITIADNIVLHETSNKGNISVSYLIGKFIDPVGVQTHAFKCADSAELSFVGLVDINSALKKLPKDRSKMLEQAYQVIISNNTTFTLGTNIINICEELINKQKHENNKTKISKAMSYILRHGAKDLGIPMDEHARILMSDLLSQPNFENVNIDMIMEIVNENNKKRFEVETIDGNLMIRAVQGHSKEFDDVIDTSKLMEEITVPLEKCIHGTNKNAWNIIKTEGLKSQSRMHIHCAISEPEDNQVISGMRSDTKVLIYIDMEKAMNDNIKFYLSKNKVILTDGLNGLLEPKYFKNVIIR